MSRNEIFGVEETPSEQVDKACMKLLYDFPFFGHMVQYLNVVESEDVPTAGITENSLMLYNPEFIDGLTDEETMGVVAHEVMHKALKSFRRQKGRDGQDWNVAQDLVINYMLIHENNLELPEEGLIPDSDGVFQPEGSDERIENVDEKSSEQLYEEVQDLSDDVDGFDVHLSMEDMDIDPEEGDEGDVKISLPGEGEVEVDEDMVGEGEEEVPDDKDWDEIVSSAARKSQQQQGSMPAGAEDVIKVTESGSVDYKRLIQQTISSNVPSDYTFTRPRRGSQAVGSYLPGIRRDEKLDVITVLDTSGSVNDALLNKFVGEIQSLVETFENVNLTVIQHDAEVQSVDEHDNAKKRDFSEFDVKGRGGTSHVPVFEEIEENHQTHGPTVAICLTDGYTTVPDEIPEIENLIWVLDNHDVQMDRLKHGRIVRLDPDEIPG